MLVVALCLVSCAVNMILYMVLCCIAIMFFHNYSWGAAISSRRLFFDCQLQSGQVHKSSYCCCLLAISLWSDFSETVQFRQWMRIHWRINYCYYYICLMAFSRTTWVGRHHKGKPFWILLEQEMMGWQSGSGISWTKYKSSAPHSRKITMPVPHQSCFYRPDALPAAQPTASKHWHIKFKFTGLAMCMYA